MPELPRYAELHCLSNFTFLRGASHPEELVEQAHALGYAALALTDECSLAGVVRAHSAAKDRGLKLVIGTEVKFLDGPRLVFLAQDREGYGWLSALITQGRRRAAKGDYRLERADLAAGLDHCLALLLPKRGLGVDELERLKAEAGWLAGRFPDERLWIAVELLREGDDGERLERLTALSRETGIPLVATGDVHMHVRERRAWQDTLTAIRLKTTVKAAGYALYPNSERHLRRREVLARLYPSELLTETIRIAERCQFSLDELRYEYPEELVPAGETPARYLRDLTETGMQRRWPAGVPAKVTAQIEHELQLIAELGYESYFLTVHDIVAFARTPRHPLPRTGLRGQLRGLLLPRHHRGGSRAHGDAFRALCLQGAPGAARHRRRLRARAARGGDPVPLREVRARARRPRRDRDHLPC